MKKFYAHFGSDGINRVLAEGIEPPVKGERAIWNREIRARFGPIHNCEFVGGEIRKKQKSKSKPKRKINWVTVAAATAAAAGGVLAGSMWG